MVARNPHLEKLKAGYLFPEIAKYKTQFLQQHPDADLISLGIGDTTEPLPPITVQALKEYADRLSKKDTYSGYTPAGGAPKLREKIAQVVYNDAFSPQEIFISDGAKCDIARLQTLFGANCTIAAQDPAYPVYVDSAVILGQTGEYQEKTKQYDRFTYLPCTVENNFFPEINKIPRTDIIYFCSPYNPVGVVATRKYLEELVQLAKHNRSIIVFDAAYAAFIQGNELPRSIFEIEGAKEVAIEIGSFSKWAGFTGVRLGWSVVPKELKFDEGSPVITDWDRINSTLFNNASNIVQHSGLAALRPEGLKQMQERIDLYMNNVKILKNTCDELGLPSYGGEHAPYLWVQTPGMTSWEAFHLLLEKAHVICTPGSGFGPTGEGFIRLSAFGNPQKIQEACLRIKKELKHETSCSNRK